MVYCELCEKREATHTLKVCDACYNDVVLSKTDIDKDQEAENDIQSGDTSGK